MGGRAQWVHGEMIDAWGCHRISAGGRHPVFRLSGQAPFVAQVGKSANFATNSEHHCITPQTETFPTYACKLHTGCRIGEYVLQGEGW